MANFSSVDLFGNRGAYRDRYDCRPSQAYSRPHQQCDEEGPRQIEHAALTRGESVAPMNPALLKIVATEATWTRDTSTDVAARIPASAAAQKKRAKKLSVSAIGRLLAKPVADAALHWRRRGRDVGRHRFGFR
jgi:hypothetical protein